MLKFEGIAIGTTIKAFDFEPMEGRRDRYVVGEIRDIVTKDGAKFYVIRCQEDSAFGPKHNRCSHDVYVPMEMMFSDFDERITVVEDAEDNFFAPKSALMIKLAEELGLEVVDISLPAEVDLRGLPEEK